MELIYGENFQYPHPHVTYYLYDKTVVGDDAPATPDTAVVLTGLIAPRGLDDGFLRFQGATGPKDFKDMYGDINIKKHGLMGHFAERILENGGQVIARRLMPEDATLSNALVSLRANKDEKVTFYVDSRGKIHGEEKWEDEDGKIFDEEVDEADPIEKVTIDTYGFHFLTKNKEEINEPGGLDIIGTAELFTEWDDYLKAEEIGEYEITDVSEEEGDIVATLDSVEGLEKDAMFFLDEDEEETAYVDEINEDDDEIVLRGIDEVGDVDTGTYDFYETDGIGEVNLPLYALSVLGRGRWGNDFKMFFTETRSETQGHTIFNYELADIKNQEIVDRYDLSHVPDLADDGIPVNLPDVIEQFSSKLGMTFFDDHYDQFDFVMEDILEDIIGQLKVENEGDANLEPLISLLEEELEKVEDPEEPYLNEMEIFGGDMFPVLEYEWTGADPNNGEEVTVELEFDMNLLFETDSLEEISFDCGHDGALADMKRFDWDYEDEEGDKVVKDMFADLYSGRLDPVVNDLTEINADVIIDVGYPTEVKEAIAGLTSDNRRSDIAYIMGIPSHIRDQEMLELYHMTFDPDNMQMMKVGQNCEWRDPDGRIHRIPISALLWRNLITHYSRGYDEPFAGRNVQITGIEPGSLRPKPIFAEERADFEDMDYNVVVRDDNNYFLDGQMTNYKVDYSRLKEFFNILIKGRIIKTALPFLDSRKHKLQTDENVERIREQLEKNLRQQYGGKVSSIDVEAGYESEQEEMRGDVTIRIYVAPRGSIKRFRALMYVVPNI